MAATKRQMTTGTGEDVESEASRVAGGHGGKQVLKTPNVN